MKLSTVLKVKLLIIKSPSVQRYSLPFHYNRLDRYTHRHIATSAYRQAG